MPNLKLLFCICNVSVELLCHNMNNFIQFLNPNWAQIFKTHPVSASERGNIVLICQYHVVRVLVVVLLCIHLVQRHDQLLVCMPLYVTLPLGHMAHQVAGRLLQMGLCLTTCLSCVNDFVPLGHYLT